MALRTYEQQALVGFSQTLRTLGVPAVYVNGSGATKTIRAVFRNREEVMGSDVTRIVAGQPVIRVLEADIDDRDTTNAKFTIKGVIYYADLYDNDGHGIMKIFLRI